MGVVGVCVPEVVYILARMCRSMGLFLLLMFPRGMKWLLACVIVSAMNLVS